jgi:hypothetical protein
VANAEPKIHPTENSAANAVLNSYCAVPSAAKRTFRHLDFAVNVALL